MADEKTYSAREAAVAVLKKAGEVLKESELMKAEHKDQNQKKANAEPSEHNSKDAGQSAEGPAPKGEIKPKAHMEGEPAKVGDRVEDQKSPEDNPSEQKEGNNNEWGTAPATYGTLKLAHFIGRKQAKREQASKQIASPDAQQVADPKNK